MRNCGGTEANIYVPFSSFVMLLFCVSSFFVVNMIDVFPFPPFGVLGVVNIGNVMTICGLLKFCTFFFILFFLSQLL